MSGVQKSVRAFVPFLVFALAFFSLHMMDKTHESEISDKIDAYNTGLEELKDGSLSQALQSFEMSISAEPDDARIKTMARYNIGTLFLKAVLRGEIEQEGLLYARHFLVQALRDAPQETNRDIRTKDEIARQLDIVNSLLKQELAEGDEGSSEDFEDMVDEMMAEEGLDHSDGSEESPDPVKEKDF